MGMNDAPGSQRLPSQEAENRKQLTKKEVIETRDRCLNMVELLEKQLNSRERESGKIDVKQVIGMLTQDIYTLSNMEIVE